MTHLLVVDDHRSIRDPLAAYLRRQGFEVSTASNGVEARAHLLKLHFDLVVLDRMMPGEDGLSLCRHIGQDYGTPVILLTAKADHADRITGLDQGADDYVTKPFSVDELVARIRSVLRRAGGVGVSVSGGSAGVEGVVVEALGNQDAVGDAEVAGDGDGGRGEVGEEGA